MWRPLKNNYFIDHFCGIYLGCGVWKCQLCLSFYSQANICICCFKICTWSSSSWCHLFWEAHTSSCKKTPTQLYSATPVLQFSQACKLFLYFFKCNYSHCGLILISGFSDHRHVSKNVCHCPCVYSASVTPFDWNLHVFEVCLIHQWWTSFFTGKLFKKKNFFEDHFK